jgi:serine/threonine protein kinase
VAAAWAWYIGRRDIKLGRRVALKFLPEESVKDLGALRRFEHEARSASALEHPNICPIYEFGEHEGQPFIVMQLLEGQTLRQLISAAVQEKPPLELSRLLDLATQITNGLEAAHRRGIIHRDIKPGNIFVTSQGQAKILDFGLAKLTTTGTVAEEDSEQTCRGDLGSGATPRETAAKATSDSFLSRTGVAMGTAGYMSPEQVRGEKLDVRTDLFSFGLVLYEMATGKRAFDDDTGSVRQEVILKQTPSPARELNPKIPARLEAIINRALEKDREVRYQSAAAILADLKPLKPVRKPIRWRAVTGAALVVVTLAAGRWWFFSRKAHAPTDKDTIVLGDFANGTGDPIFDDTLKQALFVDLEQSPFLHVLSDRKMAQTMQMMGLSSDDRLTATSAQELCRREGAAVWVHHEFGCRVPAHPKRHRLRNRRFNSHHAGSGNQQSRSAQDA